MSDLEQTQISNQVTEPDLNIDIGQERIKFPNNVYNLMVDRSQMRSDINIPLVNVRENIIPEKINNGSQESYLLNLSSNVNYSCHMTRTVTTTLNITGVRYSQNKTINAHMFSVEDMDSDLANMPLNDFSGLPHPYLPGIFGAVCDQNNAMLSSTSVLSGNNNQEVAINLTPRDVDIARRMLTESACRDPRYSNALLPETMNLDLMALPSQNFDLMINSNPLIEHWLVENPDVSADRLSPILRGRDRFIKQKAFLTEQTMDLNQINEIKENMLSIHNRGKCLLNANYTFSKVNDSYNYTIAFNETNANNDNAYATYQLLSDTPTKTLYTMTYGVYQLPTNVNNWADALQRGVSVENLCWYYNKNPYLYKCEKSAGDNPTYTWSYDPVLVEPSTQGLNIAIEYTVESPLINPILSEEYTRSFSNLTQLTVTCKYNTRNDKNLFRVIGNQGSRLTYGGSLNRFDATTSYAIAPDNSNGILTVDFSKQQLKYYSNQLSIIQDEVKATTVLPYLFRKEFPKALNTSAYQAIKYGDTKNWKSFQEYVYHSDQINIGGNVPRYVLIYADIENVSYTFSYLKITYNGGDVQLLSMQSLHEATIKNGLRQYTDADDTSYYSILSNSSAELTLNEHPKYDNFNGKGSILLLDFGQSIVLPSGVVSLNTGLDFNIQYELGVTFKDEYVGTSDIYNRSLNGRITITHLTEQDYILSGNTGDTKAVMFSPLQVAAAFETMKKRIQSNGFYINRRKLYSGSGFMEDTFNKAKYIAGKLKGLYNIGKYAAKHGPMAYHNAMNAADKVTKTINKLSDFMR